MVTGVDELVEIVARAMFLESSGNDEIDEDGADVWAALGIKQEYWVDLARACLKEIEAAGMVVVPREPTKAMIAAGVANVAYHAHSTDNAAAVWHYMVNAALSEK